MSCSVKVFTTDGVELVDLNDEAAGLYVVSVGLPDESWRRVIATSPFVDGEFETQAVREGGRLEVVQRITGSSWPQVESRRLSVRDALNGAASRLVTVTVDGVTTTWRARRADITGSVDGADIRGNRRTLLLQIPVQPNPTLTGV